MQVNIQRGEIYSANLSPSQGSEQDGKRPVIIVSRNAINQFSSVVIVVPCTDAANKKRTYPSHVRFQAGDGGLTMNSVAMCEQVRAISKDRLGNKLGMLSRANMALVDAALGISLDLSVNSGY